MPLSVRLDPDIEKVVKRLAYRSGTTRSSVVREAIAAYAAEQDGREPVREATVWNAVQHLVGVADSGGQQRSQDTGTAFTSLLRSGKRARRSR